MTGQNSSFECNDWITTGIEVQVKDSKVNSYYTVKVVYGTVYHNVLWLQSTNAC